MRFVFFTLITLSLFTSSCKATEEDITEVSLDIPVVKSGWDIYTAGTYHYGPSIIINDDNSIDAWFAAAGSDFGEALYPESSLATAVQLSGTAAQMFTTTDPYYSISVCCPTWCTTDGSMTLSLYNWDTNYSTTISNGPIVTQTYNGVADNSWLKIANDNLFPAGKYLWVLSQPVNTIGVWKYPNAKSGIQSYLNGNMVIGSYKALLLPANGVPSYWDQVVYQRSTDGGKTWTKDQMVVKPTLGSRDQLSVCDPGVAKWGGYYYLGYTSTEDTRGTCGQVYVCRSTSPTGPWEKWNGTGWGGSKPLPVIAYTENADYFGAGEPCMVVHNGKIFFYYTWNAGGEEGTTTRVATADSSDVNWPANLKVQGTVINKTNIPGSDHCDVKYRDDLKKFQAIHTASRMGPNSFIVLWESTDGISFTKVGEIRSQLKPYLHNCGWSGDALGHIKGDVQQYLSYAYGNAWGQWNTFWQPLTLKK